MNPLELNQLIVNYQRGIATSEECQILEDYWQRSLTNDAVIRDLSPIDQKNLEQRLYQGTIMRIQEQEPGAFKPIRRLYDQRWIQIAASLTGLLLLFTASWFWVSKQGNLDVSYKTRYGETKRFLLPDSSVVWLNGHSSLRYAPDTAGNRQVWLIGEALFSVKHTPTHRKFVVHTTPKLAIEVLGTVFNVIDRRGNVSVVLKSGSVRITDPKHLQADVWLKPGEMANQTNKHPILTKTSVHATAQMDWKDGAVHVENKPLGELFDWVEDTYGIQVECSSALRAETFTGTIPTHSIHSFFTMIPKLYQVRVQRNGQIYHISAVPGNAN